MTGTRVRTPSLDIEDHDDVTVVRLRDGKVNALDLEVVRAVTAAVRDVEPGRALVITRAGSAFSGCAVLSSSTKDGCT
jgi:enoyl-CoA hydratase/carnithine racemase